MNKIGGHGANNTADLLLFCISNMRPRFIKLNKEWGNATKHSL